MKTKKLKPKFKVGDVVFARWFVAGHPVGLSTDTRAIVMERTKGAPARYRVERDDRREGSWWVHEDSLRAAGES